MESPQSPTKIYQDIIDQLVNETRHLGAGAHVAKLGVYSSAPAHQSFNALTASLSDEQRSLLARMLLEERHSAIHDVLAALTWWIDCRDVGLTHKGEPMAVQLSGMGLHGDYVGRCDDWEWPGDAA